VLWNDIKKITAKGIKGRSQLDTEKIHGKSKWHRKKRKILQAKTEKKEK